jgi:hypothetical protein
MMNFQLRLSLTDLSGTFNKKLLKERKLFEIEF